MAKYNTIRDFVAALEGLNNDKYKRAFVNNGNRYGLGLSIENESKLPCLLVNVDGGTKSTSLSNFSEYFEKELELDSSDSKTIDDIIEETNVDVVFDYLYRKAVDYMWDVATMYASFLETCVVTFTETEVPIAAVHYNDLLSNFEVFVNKKGVLGMASKDSLFTGNYELTMIDTVAFVLTHELLHILNQHLSRSNTELTGINGMLINIIGDQFINSSIINVFNRGSKKVMNNDLNTKPMSAGILSKIVYPFTPKSSFTLESLYNKFLSDVLKIDKKVSMSGSLPKEVRFDVRTTSEFIMEFMKNNSSVFIKRINDFLDEVSEEVKPPESSNGDEPQQGSQGSGGNQGNKGQQGSQGSGGNQGNKGNQGSDDNKQQGSGGSQNSQNKDSSDGDNNSDNQSSSSGSNQSGEKGNQGKRNPVADRNSSNGQSGNDKNKQSKEGNQGNSDKKGDKDSTGESNGSGEEGQDKQSKDNNKIKSGQTGDMNDSLTSKEALDKLRKSLEDAKKALNQSKQGNAESSENSDKQVTNDETSRDVMDKVNSAFSSALNGLVPKTENIKNWKVKLRKIVRNAMGIAEAFDQNAPSARLEGEFGRDVDVKKVKRILMCMDVSPSMSVQLFKQVLNEIETFTKSIGITHAEIKAIYWGSKAKVKKFRQLKGLTQQLAAGADEQRSTVFDSLFSELSKEKKFDLCVICTDGEIWTNESGIEQKIKAFFNRHKSRTIWVLTKNGNTKEFISKVDPTCKNRVIQAK
nr:MAG TPA: Putative metallopeptidase domain protein [Caudoviricetes sp.]